MEHVATISRSSMELRSSLGSLETKFIECRTVRVLEFESRLVLSLDRLHPPSSFTSDLCQALRRLSTHLGTHLSLYGKCHRVPCAKGCFLDPNSLIKKRRSPSGSSPKPSPFSTGTKLGVRLSPEYSFFVFLSICELPAFSHPCARDGARFCRFFRSASGCFGE